MSKEVQRLPMPERIEPMMTARSLMTSVRTHFYALYNSANTAFREFLASVGNADSLTGNRLFDRHEAVTMIKSTAKKANDEIAATAKDGEIYKCIVRLMKQHDMSLKIRRQAAKQLMHSVPAE